MKADARAHPCHNMRMIFRKWYWQVLWLVLPAAWGLATDIEGVQIAALDQPRVTVMLRRTPGGEPLFGKADAAMAQLLGMDKSAESKVTSFAAYLDTGASGISISATTADAMGIKRMPSGKLAGQKVVFYDVGVGGTDKFHISEPLYLAWGSYQALGGTVADGAFEPLGGPWQGQISVNGGGVLESLMGAMDVVGMPVMAGKIVLIDPKPVNQMSDVLRVKIVTPGVGPRVQIPTTNRHVMLSYTDFAPYTRIEPEDAKRPALAANPFIGPGPGSRGEIPPIVARYRGRTVKGGWLLDTGAVASMISTSQAAELGIRYKAGTQDTPLPVLEGVPANKQFTLSLGGIGGMKKAAGFFMDELRVPTREGDDLVYLAAPVLVNDIVIENPRTHQKLALDGVFGMNFLVASAQITGGLVPDIGKIAQGPYDLIVIDHTKGVLGLQLRKDLKN